MKYKVIGVICAMEKEAEEIRRGLIEVREEEVGSLRFWVGQKGERRVVLSVCGIGKVFAAMCAQTMILHYKPDLVLNSGVAGSLTDRLDILSLAVSEKLVQHDMDTSPLGDPLGLVSGVNLVYFPADEFVLKTVLSEAEKAGIPSLAGVIASGDQFVATAEKKDFIIQNFGAVACEMEGAAVAQVCFVNRTPFCVLRTISDSFSGKNEMDYAVFAEKAAHRGANFLLSLLGKTNIL